MKKRLAIALLSWLCSNVLAQTTPPPAQTVPGAAPATSTTPATPTAAAPATPAITTGVVGGNNATYTDRIPPEQIIVLDANGDKFQARHIPDLSGLPRGAAIILHDSGQHPNWPFTAAALIDDLPLHGWDTLSIELPTPAADNIQAEISAPAPPPAPTSPIPTASTAAPNTTTPVPAAAPGIPSIEPQTQARISTAIKYFTDKNQSNIVLIGFGSGAIRAAENLRLIAVVNTSTPNDTKPLTALVMIAPLQQLDGIDMDLPKLLPLTGIATLDMRLDSESQARTEAEERRRAVLHQRTRIYTRLELPPLNNISDAQHSTMVKRVQSWLQKYAHAPKKPAATQPQNPVVAQPQNPASVTPQP